MSVSKPPPQNGVESATMKHLASSLAIFSLFAFPLFAHARQKDVLAEGFRRADSNGDGNPRTSCGCC